MSDDKLDLKLNLDVDVHNAEKAKALREELARIDAELTAIGKHTNDSLKALGSMARAVTGLRSKGSASDAGARAAVEGERDLYAELRKRFAFERRMASQRKAEESESARAAREEAREVERRFREQMAFNTRIAAQRAAEERAAETAIQREVRETGRMRDREARKAISDARALRREQEKAATQIRTGAGQVRAGAGRAVAVGGTAAAASVYAANRTVAALTRSGVDLDKALNANTRLSGLSPKDADAKGKNLVKQAAPIARQLGIRTSEYLSARAEALQAGVDEALVDAVTEFGSKYARLNDINPSEVMESSGYGITALGAFGKLSADKIKQLFNLQQHLAATTAASRTGLSSFVRRGLSAGAAAGFSLEDTLAFGGAATSSGADGESASRMLSSVTERLASMPTRAAGISRKKHKSPKDYLIMQLPRKLGFGSWKALKEGLSKDAAGTMEGIYEGLAAITDPRARLEASEEIFGKEFGSVHAGMAVGHRFRDMRKSVRSKEAGNAIDSGMSIRSGSFDFIMDQIGSTVQSLKDGLGMVLKPFWSDLRDWAIQTPKAFESFDIAFKSGITGFLTGLGSPDGTMSGLLRTWLGDPGQFQMNARAVGDFAKGVGQGIRDIGSAIRSFVGLFAGQNASPEELGKWSARILGLSAALLVAAPAVAVLGGLATAIGGFTTAVLGAWRLMKAAGLVGATGAGAAPAVAGAGIVGRMAAFLSRFAPAMAMPLTTDASKEDKDKLMRRLGAYALEIEKQRKATDKNTEAVEEGAKIQKQSFQDESFKSLIHKASITTGETVTESIRSTARTALSGVVGGGGDGPAINSSTPGGSLGHGLTGMRRRGIIGGGGGQASSGGSRAWRNRNPGNIKFGQFAQSQGATGADDKGFAVFPSYEAGIKAQENLLFNSKSYSGLTIAEAIRKWAPGSDGNNPESYAADLARSAGVGVDTPLSSLSADQRSRLLDAQQRREGWSEGSTATRIAGSGTYRGVNDDIRGSANFMKGQYGGVGQNLTTITTASGKRLTVNAAAADSFRGFVDELESTGYKVKSLFGFNARRIRGGSGWSQHAYGNAIDINPAENPMGYGPLKTDLPNNVSDMAAKYGLTWGGDWKRRKDAMHFEWAGRSPDLAGGQTAPSAGLGADGKVPLRNEGVNNLIRNNSAGGPGGSGSPKIDIHVNGAHHTPEELANTVQRKIQESMNRRTHDYDTFA
ncbi:phage tail tape measure protein [Methylobacterium sp. SD21]|uniref:phage tail tape measure protein n=1 Tax=Methylobacterium litchii TaxID=3138810 RepID=UPI00313AB0E9